MKGKEEAVSLPEEIPNPLNTEHQSNSPEDNPFVVNKQGKLMIRIVGPHEKVSAEMEVDAEGVSVIGSTLTDKFLYSTYFLVVIRTIVPLCLKHLNDHGYTREGRRYATRNVAATGIFILASFSILKWTGTGNHLSDLAKKSMKTLFTGAVPIEDSPENANQLEVLREQLAEVLGANLILPSSLSGE